MSKVELWDVLVEKPLKPWVLEAERTLVSGQANAEAIADALRRSGKFNRVIIRLSR
jgi:hypothetical protein